MSQLRVYFASRQIVPGLFCFRRGCQFVERFAFGFASSMLSCACFVWFLRLARCQCALPLVFIVSDWANHLVIMCQGLSSCLDVARSARLPGPGTWSSCLDVARSGWSCLVLSSGWAGQDVGQDVGHHSGWLVITLGG